MNVVHAGATRHLLADAFVYGCCSHCLVSAHLASVSARTGGGVLFVVNWRGGIVSGGRAFRALDSRHRQWHEACLLAAVRHAQTPIYFAASRAAGKANRFGRTPVGAWEDVNCSGGWQARCHYLGPVLLSVADDFCSSGSWPRGPDLFTKFSRQQIVSSRRSYLQY